MQTVIAVVKSVWKWKAVLISVKPKGIIVSFMESLFNLMAKCDKKFISKCDRCFDFVDFVRRFCYKMRRLL